MTPAELPPPGPGVRQGGGARGRRAAALSPAFPWGRAAGGAAVAGAVPGHPAGHVKPVVIPAAATAFASVPAPALRVPAPQAEAAP